MNPGRSPGARRDRILAVARKVFAERGYHEAGVAEIAAALPIGHGTFYRNFASKLELFESVVDQAMSQLCETIRRENATASSSRREFQAQIERLSGSVLELCQSNPDLGQLLFEDAGAVSRDLADRLDLGWAECGRLTERHLAHGVREGYLTASLDSQTTALALNAMIFEGARRLSRTRDPGAGWDGARWSAAVSCMLVGAPAASLAPTPDHRGVDPAWTSGRRGL